MHDILINFLEKKTKVVEDEDESLQDKDGKQPEKSKSRQREGTIGESAPTPFQRTSGTD